MRYTVLHDWFDLLFDVLPVLHDWFNLLFDVLPIDSPLSTLLSPILASSFPSRRFSRKGQVFS